MEFKTEIRCLAELMQMSEEDVQHCLELAKSAENDSFKPTDGMVREAKKGLEWRREHGRGGTDVGIARARDIASGKNLPLKTVKRMHSFFSRHEVDKKGKGFSPGEDGFPSNGRIAWALWGGDPGQTWAASIVERAKKREKASANIDPDLLKMKSILVSQGMNLNDDVFLKEELIKARLTGAHKPVNIEHQDTEIVSHMLETYVVSKSGERLDSAEDIENEDLIDIVNESVIYAYIFPEVSARIEELAAKNQLFVSVEAWFSDYDYLVGEDIVKRTSATSDILEKHLRINGGEGVYEEKKVGRVLRNLMFGGVGVVATPANPDSLILEVGDTENKAASEQSILASHIIGNFEAKKEKIMENPQLDDSNSVEETDLEISEASITEESEVNGADDVEMTNASEEDVSESTDQESEAQDQDLDISDASGDIHMSESIEASEEEVVEESSEDQVSEDSENLESEASMHEEEQDSGYHDKEQAMGEHGAHHHPEIMAKVDEMMAILSGMTDMVTKQNEIIGGMHDKMKEIEAGQIVNDRHKKMMEAGMDSEMIDSRADRVSAMSDQEFNDYIEDVKSLLVKSIASLEDVPEQVELKEVEEQVVDSEIDLSKIESTDAEINIDSDSSDPTYQRFFQAVSSSFNKRNKR